MKKLPAAICVSHRVVIVTVAILNFQKNDGTKNWLRVLYF